MAAIFFNVYSVNTYDTVTSSGSTVCNLCVYVKGEKYMQVHIWVNSQFEDWTEREKQSIKGRDEINRYS